MDHLELTATTDEPHPTCTAIVCAYNEARTTGIVIEALLTSPHIDEIVVVDDGSRDATPAIVQQYARFDKVNAICFERNRGKGYAMAEAAVRAQGDALLYVDADLVNWKECYTAQVQLHEIAQRLWQFGEVHSVESKFSCP